MVHNVAAYVELVNTELLFLGELQDYCEPENVCENVVSLWAQRFHQQINAQPCFMTVSD